MNSDQTPSLEVKSDNTTEETAAAEPTSGLGAVAVGQVELVRELQTNESDLPVSNRLSGLGKRATEGVLAEMRRQLRRKPRQSLPARNNL